MAATEEPARGRPTADPTPLTTDALEREVKNAKEFTTDAVKHERELRQQNERAVRDKFTDLEAHRTEQKQDTQENINKAFVANADSIKTLEKSLDELKDVVSGLVPYRQGSIDSRSAVFGTILLVIAILGFLAANGVFSQGS